MARCARLVGWLGMCVVALGFLGLSPAAARQSHPAARSGGEAAPVFAWIVLDAETGQVIGEQNADVSTYPASLTKMMTLYLTFEALNQGRIRLDQSFLVSEEAARRAPSKLALTPSDSVPVRDLILGMVTKSANDAASVVAEGLAGSEARFADYMNWKARQLGMQHTWYRNASGLPDPEQRTTARDVARLALALCQQFPREYRYFSTREFEFRGDLVKSHNHMLDWYPGLDGIKTGFVNASGFNLAASAVRNGRRLIGVVMGGRSWRSRDEQMGSLLDQAFAIVAARPPSAQSGTAVAAAAPAPAPSAPLPAQPAAQPVAMPPPAAIPMVAAATTTPTATRVSASGDAGGARTKPGGGDWSIQLGTFKGEAAAQQATRHVASLPIARGKPREVLAPGRRDAGGLYRARVLHFTEKGAQAACAQLHKKGIACSVVGPSA